MTAFKETFTGREDRARVLTEILSHGPAAPGATFVADVDRASLAVLTVRRMPTPEPIVDEDSSFDHESIRRLSVALRAIAQDAAPQRTWTGGRWSAMTSELITVVCREGEAAITPVEMQFFWGWRYSNHLTTAHDGDVYVVTPVGWATLGGEWFGTQPVLPIGADPLGTAPEVQDAEKVLADASLALLGPEPGECVLCYVHRMLVNFGCDGRLRFAAHYRDVRAPQATALERRLGSVGGYCDCEIFLNGYDLRPEHWLPDFASDHGYLDHYPGGPNNYPGEPDTYLGEHNTYLGEHNTYLGDYNTYLGEPDYFPGEPDYYPGEPDTYRGEPDDYHAELDDDQDIWPSRLPPCARVRAGSTRPCALWCRSHRW